MPRKNGIKAKIAAVILAVGMALSVTSPALAGDGYRGTRVHGCRAYIQGKSAWTNCTPATKSTYVNTKAWCTAYPVQYGSQKWVKKGLTYYRVSYVECPFNVHTAQALVQ